MLFTTPYMVRRFGMSRRMAGQEDLSSETKKASISRNSDNLGYLCDIIYELKQLADRSGQRTLSAILGAALTEARIQSDEARRWP